MNQLISPRSHILFTDFNFRLSGGMSLKTSVVLQAYLFNAITPYIPSLKRMGFTAYLINLYSDTTSSPSDNKLGEVSGKQVRLIKDDDGLKLLLGQEKKAIPNRLFEEILSKNSKDFKKIKDETGKSVYDKVFSEYKSKEKSGLKRISAFIRNLFTSNNDSKIEKYLKETIDEKASKSDINAIIEKHSLDSKILKLNMTNTLKRGVLKNFRDEHQIDFSIIGEIYYPNASTCFDGEPAIPDDDVSKLLSIIDEYEIANLGELYEHLNQLEIEDSKNLLYLAGIYSITELKPVLNSHSKFKKNELSFSTEKNDFKNGENVRAFIKQTVKSQFYVGMSINDFASKTNEARRDIKQSYRFPKKPLFNFFTNIDPHLKEPLTKSHNVKIEDLYNEYPDLIKNRDHPKIIGNKEELYKILSESDIKVGESKKEFKRKINNFLAINNNFEKNDYYTGKTEKGFIKALSEWLLIK